VKKAGGTTSSFESVERTATTTTTTITSTSTQLSSSSFPTKEQVDNQQWYSPKKTPSTTEVTTLPKKMSQPDLSSGYSSSEQKDSTESTPVTETRSLSRKGSSDAELLFGEKTAEFYRSKYAYSGYTSQGKSTDIDVIFGGSSSSISSATGAIKSSFDSPAASTTKYNKSNTSGDQGISNPVFKDSFDTASSTGAISKRWSRDEDDYDLR
jgi:hypothetical protein